MAASFDHSNKSRQPWSGIDRRDDLSAPDRFDVYYGMANTCVGVARLDQEYFLPVAEIVDPQEAKT